MPPTIEEGFIQKRTLEHIFLPSKLYSYMCAENKQFKKEDRFASIPCRVSYFAPGRLEELADLHQDELKNRVHFNSSWCKIASTARNLRNLVPQEAAATFAFSMPLTHKKAN